MHNGGVDTPTDVLGDAWTCRTLHLKDDPATRRTGIEPVATLVSQRDVDPGRVAVLWVHGFVDYFFHDHLAAPLAAAGYQLYGLDLRDCGRSYQEGRAINDTDNLARYTEEIDRSVRELGLVHGKVVVAAHSTGGLTTALWADARPYLVSRGTLAALVLNSPWLDLRAGRWAKTVASVGSDLVGRVAPRTVVTHLGEHYGKALHVDTGGEWDYNLDWKSHESPPVTAGFVRSVRQAQTRVAHGLDITCPVLVLASDSSGPHDRHHDDLVTTDCVLDVADIERLAPRLGADVTFKQVERGAHDLSLSPSPARESFVDTMITFLDARTR